MTKHLNNIKNKDCNNVLVVIIIQTPISERYCKVGDEATLDVKNKQIRCGSVWFNFDERWIVRRE